jgi:hypothetical protein
MTVDELLTRCDLVRASEEKLSGCKPFSCGEGDLDEFFDLLKLNVNES